MQDVEKDAARLTKQFQLMQSGLAKAMDPALLRDMRAGFLSNLGTLGEFGVQSVKAKSATQQFTESLVKSDVGMRQALKSRKMFNSVLREQFELQKMVTMQWTRNAAGTMSADVIVPRGTDAEVQKLTKSFRSNLQAIRESTRGTVEHTRAVDTMRMRFGLMNEILNSSGKNMINWGKNTQWAGRQLMVGFTVPFAAFAAVAGMAAYKVDKELTRIVKVYDFTAKTVAGREREMQEVRARSVEMGIQVAKRYGASLQDTLKVEAELAATGLQGNDLIRSTAEVQRIATLGEMDYQQTVKMTIALQTAFGLSTDEVTEKMNYMNSIENATSLTLADFAEATPRAASALSQLGVTVEEMGILLVAMKERGVDAAQGANALKSATTRLLKPTQDASDRFAAMGININEIGVASGGNLFKALQMLGGELKTVGSEFTNMDKQAAIAALFGTYQFNRMNAALQGVAEGTGQVGRAFAVAGQDTEAWANTADTEIRRIQESASGQFKITVETLKAQLAEMGEPFLKVAALFVKGAAGILGFFNSMPDWAKNVTLLAVGFLALTGPIVMFAGLLGNLLGNLLKMGTGLVMMTTKYRTLTLEQRANELMSKQNSAMWQNEATQAQVLSAQLRQLTAAFTGLHAEQAKANALAMGTMVPHSTMAGSAINSPYAFDPKANRWKDDKGKMVSAGTVDAFEKQAIASADIEKSSAKTKRNWSGIANSMGAVTLIGSSFAMAEGSSSKIWTNITNAAFAAALIGPGIINGLKSPKIVAALSGLKTKVATAFDAAAMNAGIAGAGKMGQMGAGTAGVLPVLGKFGLAVARFAGPVGLLATAGFAIFKIVGALKQATREQERVNASAEKWADIIGFVYSKSPGAEGAGDKSGALGEMERAAKALNEELPEVVKGIQQAGSEGEKMNRAIQEGLKVRMHGGTEAQSFKAIEAALYAATNNREMTDRMMIKVRATVDLGDPTAAAQEYAEQFGAQFQRIISNDFEAAGMWEKIGNFFDGDSLNNRARSAAKGAGREFWDVFQTSGMQERKAMFDSLEKEMKSRGDDIFNNLDISDQSRDWLSNNGYTDASSIAQLLKDIPEMNSMFGNEDRDKIKAYAEAEKVLAQQIVLSATGNEKLAGTITTVAQARGHLNMATSTVAASEKSYEEAMRRSAGMNEEQKLALLNTYRLSAGLDAATSIEQGFSAAVKNATGDLGENADAMKDASYSAEEWASAMEDALKSAYSGAQGDAISRADDFANDYQQGRMDAISTDYERRGDRLDAMGERQDNNYDRRVKKFESRWDRIMERTKNAYDARIQKVKDAIKVEEDAEKRRQAIFEAEKTRIQRLAELANQNIDMNVALAGGKFDDAAKISNDMQAAQATNAIDDAASGSGTASERRKEALNLRIEAIEKAQAAEEQALQRKKERERAALDAERERARKSLEIQRKNLQNQEKAAQRSEERRLAIKRRALDMELAVIRASTPRNKKEYDNQIRQIEGAYGRYGVRLKAYGNQWTGYIGANLKSNITAAHKSLQNDVNWRQMGAEITNQFLQGAFGLNTREFARWVTTGDLPKGGLSGGASRPKGHVQGNMYIMPNGKPVPLHGGGIVGMGGGDRRGVSASAGRYPSEVDTRLRVGEAVLNEKATRGLGADFINKANKHGVGGGDLGLSGVAGALLAGSMRAAMQGVSLRAGTDRLMQEAISVTGQAGKYGNTQLSAEQLRNAATIINTGKGMGASHRDLIISLMTAMQESNLRNLNYGDRDSVGLFQQRTSQGWGSIEQIMNPAYAAKKFFQALFRVENRGSMSLTGAAQAVQRSAFPNAYAKWEDEARAILAGTAYATGTPGAGAMRPVSGQVTSRFGMRRHPITGVYKLHDGSDIAAPYGTQIRAALAGKVVRASMASGYGNWTVIDSPGGVQTGYAHQSTMAVRPGQQVGRGQGIGRIGMTGNTTGPHLHFMYGRNGTWQNPGRLIPGLKMGGVTMNEGIANLHKKETVLTAPLSEKLNVGIDNLAKGDNVGYHITLDLRGSTIAADVDIERAVYKALDKKENKLGRGRTVK